MKIRTKSKARKGASAVEMAIVAPVFVALILGQIETSRLGMVSQLLTTAARRDLLGLGDQIAVDEGAFPN